MLELENRIKIFETREKERAAEVQSMKRQYAPSIFLGDSRREKGTKQPDRLKPHEQAGGQFQLTKACKRLCKHPVLSFGLDEVIWPKKPADAISRAVVVRPTHVWHDGDTSTRPEPSIVVDDIYEFFFQGADEKWT